MERMKLDIIFKNAFKEVETDKPGHIMISSQDEHGDILPIMDPLDYLEHKKEQNRNIEINDSNSEYEEGFHRGELIPLGYDREEDEDKRVRFQQQQKVDEFPDVNIGIPEEVKMREDAKLAKVRELQGKDKNNNETKTIPESTLEEMLEQMDDIKQFNRKLEEAMLKRDNLLKLVNKEDKPKTLDHITGERDYEEYDVNELDDAVQRAKNEQELRNLRDYEAIKILQKVLPEATDSAADLPQAVSHFLNNPFEFLVYDTPEAIPEEVREKVIANNLNLLVNDEKYLKQVNILENQQLHKKTFNSNVLYDEYTKGDEDADPIDQDFVSKYFKVKRKNKKWYPEDAEAKRIEQLE